MVSTLYLWGYWGTFGVNVLDYIGVSDIIKAAVYPVMTAFMSLAVGALMGEFLSPKLEPGAGTDTRIGKWLHGALPILTLAYGLVMVAIVMFSWPNKWLVIGAMLAVPTYFQLQRSAFLAREIPSDRARSLVIFLLIMAAPIAYQRGRTEAVGVTEGSSYQAVVSELPTKNTFAQATPAEKPRFVGKLGDRFAMYDPVEHSVSLIASSELKVLTLVSSASAKDAQNASPVTAPASAASGTSSAAGVAQQASAASGVSREAASQAAPPSASAIVPSTKR
ncbi:hypothetical protein Ddc_22133 [Ditylenchus destructor]|nr:hypothetical protein Ddc_22133 [Ditylenchus destructor]